MDRLSLHPTAVAQWFALVKDAETLCHSQLNEELESYLVMLLERFITKPDIVRSIVALEFLESQHKLSAQQQIGLRDVGDKCLLFSGLFPEFAIHRHVPVSYFIAVGREAYCLLSVHQTGLAKLFHALEINFVTLMDVLQSSRELAGEEFGISPLQAEEIWRATGSPHARAVLRRWVKKDFLALGNNQVH